MTALPSDTFARRLRAERERQRISQAELARGIAEILGTNIDQSAVTRIEQQTRAVRLDEAMAMASVLNVPITMLLMDLDADEKEELRQEYLAQLVTKQREWELMRQEIGRLTGLIQSLSMTHTHFHGHEI